jgi:signal transduction histidine kinase
LLFNPLVLLSALLGFALIGLIAWFSGRRARLPWLHTAARAAALDRMGDGLIVIDRDRLIVEHNPAAVRLAALDSPAVGRPLAGAVRDGALGALLDSMFAESGPSERTLQLADPEPRRLHVALEPLADSHGRPQGALLLLRDQTEQLRAEELLKRQSDSLAALRQAAEVAAAPQNRPDQLRSIAAAARQALGVDHASVGLLDSARGQLTIAAESDAEADASLIGAMIRVHGETCVRAWQLEEPIVAADPQHDQRLFFMRDLLARHDPHALLIAPIRAGDRLIGTLNFASGTPREFSHNDIAMAQAIAGCAAAAVDNAQLSSVARQADRAKSAVLDTVSHEFRTPITAILGFTELYQENVLGPVSEEQREALDAVHRNAHRLLKLVDDLLDLARLEAGKLDMALYPVEVGLCIKEAVGLLAAQFQQKQLDLRLEIADELPLAWADAMWLRRVLSNLLGNALRYTNTGSITVRAYETAARRLAIEIEDTGRGIPEAEQELIFDAFQRAAGAHNTAPTSTGSGLGLTISKRAIDQMDGQLALHSQPGGSTFTITLHAAELALEHPHG